MTGGHLAHAVCGEHWSAKTVNFTESDCSSDHLAIVVSGLHFKDVGDNTVDLDVTNEPGEEELLSDGRTHQSESWEAQE